MVVATVEICFTSVHTVTRRDDLVFGDWERRNLGRMGLCVG